MNKIYFRACWLIILLMMPWLIYAAGLGKLTLASSLGQPLKAEIELVSVIEDEILSLTARVASSEAFRQAGMAYAPYHSSLVVSVEKRVNGQPYIQITSPHSINEPFVNLLIELDGASGRLLREYTVLLDPDETPPIVESATLVAQQAPDSLQTTPQVNGNIQSRASVNKNSEMNGASAYRQEPGTYGPVVQGDTLTKIAKRISPEGVDLNRMLVALYQANQNAFFEKNMNLLKVGAILRIPDQNEISAISQREASQEIKAQTASWHAYRLRVSEAAMGSLPKTESQQSAAGRITTTIEEESLVTKNVPSEEVLILSKGESSESLQTSNNFEGERTVATQEYLRMMEEDTIAKERALQEANERVTLLEQNIERLQRLLEIKGTGMTDAQIQAKQPLTQLDSTLPSASVSDEIEAIPGDSMDLATADERDQAENTEVIMPAQSVILEQAVNQAAPLPDSSEPIESPLLDQVIGFVTDNFELVGMVLAVLLTGWLGLSFLRRRKERGDEMDDIFDYEEVPKGNMKASAGGAGLAPTETMILSDNVQAKKEESVLGSVEDSKFFKSEEPKGDLSESASGFFFGKKINENLVADQNANSDSESVKRGSDQLIDHIGEPAHENSEIKNTTDFSYASPSYDLVEDEPETPVTKNEPPPDLEFTLNLEAEQADNESTSPAEKGIPFSIDFSDAIKASSDSVTPLNEEVKPLSVQDDDDQPLTQFNLSDIKLDLDDEAQKTNQDDVPVEVVSTPWDEVAVKVDLAKAYLEMDDKEGAREILKEVIREGNEEQQSIAQSMLEGLK